MFKYSETLLVKAVSPVHAGSGREIGLIDMPIQKESHTQIPKIEASSLKGSLRNSYRVNNDDKSTSYIFGSDDDRAGFIGFSDASLLFYPIRCITNLFAYVTCPYLLNNFLENLNICAGDNQKEYVKHSLNGKAIIYNAEKDKFIEESIILDTYKFEAKLEDAIDENTKSIKDILEKICEKFTLKRNIVIVTDEDFIELITICKEIITRNKINADTGTVDEKTGGLFTEEYLPAEAILQTMMLTNGIINDEDDKIKMYKEQIEGTYQIGGNANIGKGIVKIVKYK